MTSQNEPYCCLSRDGGHEVLWFANELVDRWLNVEQWWLACTELARQTLAYMSTARLAHE